MNTRNKYIPSLSCSSLKRLSTAACLLAGISTQLSAAQPISLFEFNALRTNPSSDISNKERTAVGSIFIDSHAANSLNIDDSATISLPDGTTDLATVVKILDQGEKQTKIMALKAGGSLEIEFDKSGQVDELSIHYKDNASIFQSELSGTDAGMLYRENLDEHLCVDFPIEVSSNDTALDQFAAPIYYPTLSEVKALQSKAGADKVLFIDYWGGVVSGTHWNYTYHNGRDIVYEPYGFDDDSSTFNYVERGVIWSGWQQTADDFSSFDINVTTDISVFNATPEVNRVRAIATPTNWRGSGGVATLGSFSAGDYYNVAWVWNLNTRSLGGTISHEVGHQLGLYHDGVQNPDGTGSPYYRGHGQWFPIMGSNGSEWLRFGQWSKGEYPGATETQDDLTIINETLEISTDDANGTYRDAKILTTTDGFKYGTIDPTGLTARDVDIYKLELKQQSNIELSVGAKAYNKFDSDPLVPTTFGSNLSFKASFLNSKREILATFLPHVDTHQNFLRFSGTLARGKYYIKIEALSYDPSWATGFGEYGNGGDYSIRIKQEEIEQAGPKITYPSTNDYNAVSRETFEWSAYEGATKYNLRFGSTPDGREYGVRATTSSSVLAPLILTDGSPVYVTLRWHDGSRWNISQKLEYRNFEILLTPRAGGTFVGNNVHVSWPFIDRATKYQLRLGSSKRGRDYGRFVVNEIGHSPPTIRSVAVENLPTDGSDIYMTLYIHDGSRWIRVVEQVSTAWTAPDNSCETTTTGLAFNRVNGTISDAAYGPENTIDGCVNLSSTWSGDAGASLNFELQDAVPVKGIYVWPAFDRVEYLTVETLSIKDPNFKVYQTEVERFPTSANGEPTFIAFNNDPLVKVDEIRITGHGSDVNDWTNISEVRWVME